MTSEISSVVHNYDTLKVRAEALSPTSHPDTINTLVGDISGQGAIYRNTLMRTIKEKTGMTLEAQRNALYERKENADPDHLDLAYAVIDELGYDNLLSTSAHLWTWDNCGTWKSIPDRKIKQIVQVGIKGGGEAVSRGLVDGVTEVLKTHAFRPEHEWNLKQDAINVLNGELHWNGSDWDLKPHKREHYLTTQIPHQYDPNAECPRFTAFLKEIFAGDEDAEDKERALLEMMGYTLACNTKFERFVLLIGGGANGKSVVLDIIRLLVGGENACAVQPAEFSNKFQRAHLHLKLANLVTEIPEGSVMADAELKAIVSGELTTVERKNQHPFDFRPYATCWFGTNHMPHTRDFTDAIFRRALVMPFNNTFKIGVNADPMLKEKLARELSGILTMVLRSYGEALRRNKFTDPESCITAKQEWRIEADQVAEFISEMCELTVGWRTSSKELYEAYEGWARSAGINRKLGRKSFTTRLLKHGCDLDKSTGGIRMITGIELRKQ